MAALWHRAFKVTVSTMGLLLLSRAELLKNWCGGYFVLFSSLTPSSLSAAFYLEFLQLHEVFHGGKAD